MEKTMIMCRSLTHAQRCQRLLEQNGIVSALVKAPSGLSQKGCAYALILRRHEEDALRILKERNMLSGTVYRSENAQWRERHDLS